MLSHSRTDMNPEYTFGGQCLDKLTAFFQPKSDIMCHHDILSTGILGTWALLFILKVTSNGIASVQSIILSRFQSHHLKEGRGWLKVSYSPKIKSCMGSNYVRSTGTTASFSPHTFPFHSPLARWPESINHNLGGGRINGRRNMNLPSLFSL